MQLSLPPQCWGPCSEVRQGRETEGHSEEENKGIRITQTWEQIFTSQVTTEVISLSLTSISSSLKWKLQYLPARSFSGTELIRYSHDPESKCLLKFCA